MTSEVRVTASVVILRPLVEVFDKVCNIDSAADWVPFCESARMTQPSFEPEAHNGIGPGMEGIFDFAIGPGIRFQVRQKVSEFEWGRKLVYSTAYIEYGSKMVSRLLAPLVPRTAIRSEFEASHAGTVLTVEVAVWVLPLGGNDLSRALISDGVLQALARLKRNIEHSEAARFSPWIFFNYRRNDAEFAADRIYDSIKREFGEGASFRDLYHLKLGTDFSDELRDSV